jgi:hypothetical protein
MFCHLLIRDLSFRFLLVAATPHCASRGILDWLIFCTLTPKFAILPGTEGLAGYKNYAMHFKGFLIGTALSVIVSLLIAGIIRLA